MNTCQKIILIISIASLTSCEKTEKKIVDSNNGENQLTILKFENGNYIVNGKYNSNHKPNSNFIKADNIIEYHSGLAKGLKIGLKSILRMELLTLQLRMADLK